MEGREEPVSGLEQVRGAAGLVALMKRLKESSGLSYRQLEERAAERGDVLARSTLADVFARSALPRPELLAAFVRACEGEERLPQWLAARDRAALAPSGPAASGGLAASAGSAASDGLAASAEAAATDGPTAPGGPPSAGRTLDSGPSGGAGRLLDAGLPADADRSLDAGSSAASGPSAASAPARPDADAADASGGDAQAGTPAARSRLPGGPRARTVLAVVAAAVVLAGIGAALLTPDGGDPTPPDTTGGQEVAGQADSPGTPPPRGTVRVRPVLAPGLCLTDGFVADGRYDTEVAVHRPCDEAEPPTTKLLPLGDGLYRVQWDHPEHGKGCLIVLRGGDADGLLEPRNDCGGSSRFRVVETTAATGTAGSTGTAASGAKESGTPGEDETSARTYVLRVDDDGCMGVAGPAASEPAAGTEAVVQSCDGRAAQRYLIEASS
ncbi:hypothetical protein [Streptomyces sp. NPDC059786]|uniref:hypothetical protein n=1 Tax=Streptomyces sp. NPDC059786 TaxID=3346946 RepID=UPI00365F7548